MTLEELLKAKREEILRVCASTAHTMCGFSVRSPVARPTKRAISISSLSLSLAEPFLTWEVSNTIWSSSWAAAWMWLRNVVSSLVSESACFERQCPYERPQRTAA
jgi:hypothetical protein